MLRKCMPKRFPTSLRSHAELVFRSSSTTLADHQRTLKSTVNDAREEDQQKIISREDVEMVLERMRMACGSTEEVGQLRESMGFDELSVMFEEKEPSLVEMSDAFGVFDENSDGFIDAVDLHKVLCMLGFREGVDVDACQRMIDNPRSSPTADRIQNGLSGLGFRLIRRGTTSPVLAWAGQEEAPSAVQVGKEGELRVFSDKILFPGSTITCQK
ncbi:hypothetical protein J5N97_017305 [Dioscorea zingiberensis]|uniref:EF-hand domain-containing protein n=1 Tax=Dioscorea zingiberensis TaxID=325984 RepID=A0A9D5CNN1_9LILI|nr:hypothetical protein J5N97_017305 [Dioscorea zingiberensis]